MIRVFSNEISPRVVGVILYAFRVDPISGAPIEEIASAWENYPGQVDHSTKGRQWAGGEIGLRRRTDSPARVMLATLEEACPYRLPDYGTEKPHKDFEVAP